MLGGRNADELLAHKREVEAERQRQAILRWLHAEREQSAAAAMARVMAAPR
jgi:uncharacterized protein YbaA (DUF1428 family)